MDSFYRQFISPFGENLFSNKLLPEVDMQKKMKTAGIVAEKESFLQFCEKKFAEYDPESYENSAEKQQIIIEEYIFLENILFRLTSEIDNPLSEETLCAFIHFISNRITVNTYDLVDSSDAPFYIDLAWEMLKYFKAHLTGLKKRLEEINRLKRALYTAIHKIRFIPVIFHYKSYINLVMDDIKYSQKASVEDYLISGSNYLNIALDHLFHNITKQENYITLDQILKYQETFLKGIQSYISSGKFDHRLLYRALVPYFKSALYYLKLKKRNKEEIDEVLKIRLFVLSGLLIGVFYKKVNDPSPFFKEDHEAFSVDIKTALGGFSRELALLLNESTLNIIELLYLIFSFLYHFKEYAKLNQSIYNRLVFMSRSYNSRQYRLLSTTLFLKLFPIEKFKEEILKVKKNIEANPTTTLINLYNSEIDTVYVLDEMTKNDLKVDPFIIDMLECILQVSRQVNRKLQQYKRVMEEGNPEVYKKTQLMLREVQNEITNIFTLAGDPNLFRPLNQFYSSFIDLYIKNKKMEFREDFIKKVNMIKMELMDINPIGLQVSLLLFRLGKLLYIMDITELEALEEKKSKMEEYAISREGSLKRVFKEFLNTERLNINENQIEYLVNKTQNFSVTTTGVLFPGSRIIKVIIALVDKIHELKKVDTSVFLYLYKDAFNKMRNAWLYDPIIIYYLNYYFSGRKDMRLLDIQTSTPLSGSVEWLKKPEIIQTIFSFIEAMLTHMEMQDDMSLQLERLSQMNSESLLDEAGKRQPLTQTTVNHYINDKKTLIFERPCIDDREDLIYLTDILRYYLTNIGKSSILANIKYILNELINNANRGLLKRAHFKSRGLDFELKYLLGRKDFLDKMVGKKMEYLALAGEMGFQVKVQFQVLNNTLILSVINNYKLHQKESEEINKRFLLAAKCTDLGQLKNLDLETEEGKGTGLVVVNLLLKKMGLDGQCLKLRADEDETVFKVIFPVNRIKEQEAARLASDIAREVETIPPLPKHISDLNDAIRKKDSSLDIIEGLVNRDPALAARVIQIANSPVYLRMEQVRSLKEAIQLIGLKGLGSIVLAYSSYKQLQNKVKQERIEQLIHHSEKTAYFAKKIISLLKLEVSIDNIILPALIHDIGKIIIESKNPDMYDKINHFIEDKNMTVDLVEDLLGGYYHNLVGYELTKKWNFPDVVCNIIKYHHNPRTTEEFFDEIFLIYLANEMTKYTEEEIVYENFDQNVLEFFDLQDPKKLSNLIYQINRSFPGSG